MKDFYIQQSMKAEIVFYTKSVYNYKNLNGGMQRHIYCQIIYTISYSQKTVLQILRS